MKRKRYITAGTGERYEITFSDGHVRQLRRCSTGKRHWERKGPRGWRGTTSPTEV